MSSIQTTTTTQNPVAKLYSLIMPATVFSSWGYRWSYFFRIL